VSKRIATDRPLHDNGHPDTKTAAGNRISIKKQRIFPTTAPTNRINMHKRQAVGLRIFFYNPYPILKEPSDFISQIKTPYWHLMAIGRRTACDKGFWHKTWPTEKKSLTLRQI